MKNLLLYILCSISSITLVAQIPNAFNYQAVARDAKGQILENKNISVRITIHRDHSGSTKAIFTEEFKVSTSDLGVFNLQIGKGNPTLGRFSSIKWNQENDLGVKVELDINGGSNYTDMGTLPLVAVPYAYHAWTVENPDDADADPSNELQSLSLNGNQLSITNGNSVTLPTGGGNSPWTTTSNGIGYAQSITIGDADPLIYGLQVSNNTGGVVVAHSANTENGGSVHAQSGNNGKRSCGFNMVGDFSFNAYNDGTFRQRTGEFYAGEETDKMVLNSTGGPMHLMQNGNTRMYIDTDNEIGFGTSDPAAKHHFEGDVLINTGQGYFQLGIPYENQFGYSTNNGGKDLLLGTSVNGVAFDDKFTWSNNGNYTVKGNIRMNGTGEGLVLDGPNRIWRWRANTPGDLIFLTHEDVTEESVFRVNDIGQVGIRGALIDADYAMHLKCHPSYGLKMTNEETDVNWEILSLSNGSFGFFKNGNKAAEIDGDGIYTASDMELKENILPMSSVLDKVEFLKPNTYNYKSNLSKSSIGFIAQDIQKVFPELVKKGAIDKDGGQLAVNYAGFGVIAIKAIQEQQEIIEGQQQEINKMKSILKSIEDRLSALEK